MSENELSRRERQIMRIIFKLETATVQEVRDTLEDELSLNAVRTFIQILAKKGHLKREKRGREFVYSPKKNRIVEGLSELQGVLETFFENSIGEALATHMTKKSDALSPEELDRLAELIKKARQ